MDFNKPNVENETAADLADIRQGRLDAARGFDPAIIEADPSNKPEGMIRWNGVLKKFQKLVSSAWGDLTDVFDISIAGNAGGLSSTGLTAVLQAVYPVGSVYVNADVTTNPATLLGFGTWTALGVGRVLVGQDAGNSVFDVLGETGGSADAVVVAHGHAITDSGHAHSINMVDSGLSANAEGGGSSRKILPSASNTSTNTTGISIVSAGVSGTNKNLMPYEVVKMWRRTA